MATAHTPFLCSKRVALGFAATLFLATPVLAAPAAGPATEPIGQYREQVWWVPIVPPRGDGPLHLETTVYRPAGEGPFPLAILSHGSPRDATRRRGAGRNPMRAQAEWFAERGFAVAVPMRRGYADSEGEYVERYGRCDDANFHAAGLTSANDIGGAITYFRAQAFVDPARVVLVGQSAGGWGTLATASRNPAGVVAVINFAAARGSLKPDENCSPDRLVEAVGRYGRTVRLPSLWIYTENDHYVGPALSTRMVGAWREAGASAEFRMLPPFAADGHTLFYRGISRWSPEVEPFLRELGLIR